MSVQAFKQLKFALDLAVAEHRWQDAYIILPAVVYSGYPKLSTYYIWKMTQIIITNINGLNGIEIKELTKLAYKFSTRSNQLCMEKLAITLPTASDYEIKSILDEYVPHKSVNSTHITSYKLTEDERHINTMIDAYKGLIYFNWHKNNTFMNNDPLDDDSTQIMEDGEEELNLQYNATKYLQSAFLKISDPCDWLLEPYLECITEREGKERADAVLEDYISRHDDSVSTYIFAYHYFKDTCDTEKLFNILEKIISMLPSHPLVLDYVQTMVTIFENDRSSNKPSTLNDNTLASNIDSGLEDNLSDDSQDKVKIKKEKPESQEIKDIKVEETSYKKDYSYCLLEKVYNREILMKCFKLICNFLEFPHWNNDVSGWQILNKILYIFHRGWMRCWHGTGCKSTMTEFYNHVLDHLLPFWDNLFWSTRSVKHTDTMLLYNKAYAAYLLLGNIKFIEKAFDHLIAEEKCVLYKQLHDLIHQNCKFTKKFNTLLKANMRRKENKFEHNEKAILCITNNTN